MTGDILLPCPNVSRLRVCVLGTRYRRNTDVGPILSAPVLNTLVLKVIDNAIYGAACARWRRNVTFIHSPFVSSLLVSAV